MTRHQSQSTALGRHQKQASQVGFEQKLVTNIIYPQASSAPALRRGQNSTRLERRDITLAPRCDGTTRWQSQSTALGGRLQRRALQIGFDQELSQTPPLLLSRCAQHSSRLEQHDIRFAPLCAHIRYVLMTGLFGELDSVEIKYEFIPFGETSVMLDADGNQFLVWTVNKRGVS